MRKFMTAAAIAVTLLSGGPPIASARAEAPAPKLYAAADIRADFTALYSRLQAAHFDLFAFAPRARLDAAFQDELARIDEPLDKAQIERRFQRFAALARMGHTRIQMAESDWTAYRQAGGKVFPLSVRVVDGRLYVVENRSGLEGLRPGDEIVSIDGQPARVWVERTRSHVSAETPYMADSLLEYYFARLLWVEVGPKETFQVQLRRDGRRWSVAVPARDRTQAEAFAKTQPPALNLQQPLREARMASPSIAYLRPGPFYNAEAAVEADMYDNRAFVAFIDAAFERFIASDAKALIIDLRGNPGGDNSFSDPMVAWFADRPFRFFSSFKVKVRDEAIAANAARLVANPDAAGEVSRQYAALYAGKPAGAIVDFEMACAQPRSGKRFGGRVYLLIDRQSYSNTVTVAALAQDYGFATVMGEPTSDMATTYGAMETFSLPRTGVIVGFPKAHIIRPNGDARSRGVTPDIVLASPIVQTPADEVLGAAVSHVSGTAVARPPQGRAACKGY